MTQDNVEGVDIYVPVYNFSETHHIDPANVTGAYKSVEGSEIVVRVAGYLPPYVVVMLSGIRSGSRNIRFPLKTRDQMQRNNAFWSSSVS